MRGELKNIPKIILGVEYEKALHLAHTWLSVKDGRLPRDSFARNPIRGHLLHEMQTQIEGFKNFALSSKNTVAASAYERASLLLTNALAEAKRRGVLPHTPTGDAVQEAIDRFVKNRLTQ